jgi:hypothetical protein
MDPILGQRIALRMCGDELLILEGQVAMPVAGWPLFEVRTALLAAVRRSALVVSFLSSSLRICLLLLERQNRTNRTYMLATF